MWHASLKTQYKRKHVKTHKMDKNGRNGHKNKLCTILARLELTIGSQLSNNWSVKFLLRSISENVSYLTFLKLDVLGMTGACQELAGVKFVGIFAIHFWSWWSPLTSNPPQGELNRNRCTAQQYYIITCWH